MSIDIPTWVDGRLQPVEKLEAHQRGLRHKAISVFLMRDGKVLLQRRAMGKYHTPGLWANTCCTHPFWGEASLDCATRRLGEELGLIDVALEYRDTVEYRADVGGGLIEHEVVDIFVGEVPAGVEPVPNAEEVMDTIWQPLERWPRRSRVVPRASRHGCRSTCAITQGRSSAGCPPEITPLPEIENGAPIAGRRFRCGKSRRVRRAPCRCLSIAQGGRDPHRLEARRRRYRPRSARIGIHVRRACLVDEPVGQVQRPHRAAPVELPRAAR
jgi:isopentenyl-diphosphate delta-isomerase